MSVREEDAENTSIPGTHDIGYEWTDIVLRRPKSDLGKPVAQQDIKLYVRCQGTIDGAFEPLCGCQITATFDTAALLARAAPAKAKIRAFIALCEQGATTANQTFTDDFELE